MKHANFSALIPVAAALVFSLVPAYAQQATTPSTTQRSEGNAAVLNDGQILQIVRTLNDAEIKQANEAMDESENADVKAVAQMIITDHEMSNEQMDDLLAGDLNLDDSPLNETLADEAEKTHEQLQDLSGSQYDCMYLETQVAQHEAAIRTAETQLVPNAKNAGVTQFLTAMGPKLEHHLEMAKESLGKTADCK